MTVVPSYVGYTQFHEKVLQHQESRFFGIPLKDLTHDELIYLIATLSEEKKEVKPKAEPVIDSKKLITAVNGAYRTAESVAQEIGAEVSATKGALDISTKIRKALFRNKHGYHVYTTKRLSLVEIYLAISQLISNRW